MFPSALSTGDCSVSFCPCVVSVVWVLIDCCSCGVTDSTLLFLLLLRGAGGRDGFDCLPVVFTRCWDCSLSVGFSAISTGFGLNSCAVAGGWCSYFPLVFVLCLWDLSFVDVTTGSTRFCVWTHCGTSGRCDYCLFSVGMRTLISTDSTLTIYPVMLCHWDGFPVAFSAYCTLSNLKSLCVAVCFSVYSDYFSRCVTFWVFVVFPFYSVTLGTSKS